MAKKKSEDVLNKVINDFNAAWEYVEGSWHSRWQDNHSLYNGNRIKRGYVGITDTFVPMAFTTVETLTSGMFGSKPKFMFVASQDEQDQKTDILNSLLDFYWEKDQWGLKIINTGRNTFKLGTAVDYFYWNIDHPCLINVPIRDFFIDPTASSIETAGFCGRRYLTTKEDLDSFEIIDLESKLDLDGNYLMKKKYTNLSQIVDGSQGENTDKQEKDMWYGSTVSEADKKQIEVIEYWTKDKTISIANRAVVIEDAENIFKAKDRANGNKYPKGMMPFADSRDYVDESLFYAKGEIDIIADQQELLNDITNQNIDSITYTLNQMYTLDPKYAEMINEVENLPGAVYPFEAGTLQPIPQRPIPPDAFMERTNIKNEIRETTASSEVVRGTSAEGAKSTATEINAQIAGAGQRFSLKVTQLENGYFFKMAKIVFRMIQLYVTEPMMVRIIGKDGARWEEFDPAEFAGEYEPRVQLEATINNEKQKQSADAKELLGAFLGDPEINQAELKKLVLARSFDLDPDEVESLMAQQGLPPEMGGMPPEMGMPQGMPPEAMMPPMLPQEDLKTKAEQQKIDQAEEKHNVDLAIKLQKLGAR